MSVGFETMVVIEVNAYPLGDVKEKKSSKK